MKKLRHHQISVAVRQPQRSLAENMANEFEQFTRKNNSNDWNMSLRNSSTWTVLNGEFYKGFKGLLQAHGSSTTCRLARY